MRAARRLAVSTTILAVTVAAWGAPASAKGGVVGGTGSQYFLNDSFTGTAGTVFSYGGVQDEVYVGDWNGDGKDTLAVRRGNMFYVRNSNSGGPADVVFAYGRAGDTVLVGDWNGDGTDTLAVRRGSTYYVKNSTAGGAADVVFAYGRAGDTVLVGDWNGDHTDTLAVRRGNLYYLRDSLTSGAADKTLAYGRAGDTTLVGDWNGDGFDTLGVRRPPPPPGQNWLGEINKYRVAAGLSPVTDNPAWDTGLQHHNTYLARTPASYYTGQYQSLHTENPASPYYTADGALEGGRSNLAMSSGNTPVSYIDEWLTAPFHAIGMLRPGLRQVAFASGEGYSGLDVLGGDTYQSHSAPIFFPGPGMSTNLRAYGGEIPSPVATCGWPDGLGTSYGLPLIALLPSAPASGLTGSVVGSDGTTRSTAAGSLCLVDEHTYRSSDPVYGPTGADILQSDHAVVLVSRTVYAPGSYTVIINQPGTSAIRWTFTVS